MIGQMEGVCRVCGASVSALEAPLHVEDHAQRGEFPEPPSLDGVAV